jgi:hypothetical protein
MLTIIYKIQSTFGNRDACSAEMYVCGNEVVSILSLNTTILSDVESAAELVVIEIMGTTKENKRLNNR